MSILALLWLIVVGATAGHVEAGNLVISRISITGGCDSLQILEAADRLDLYTGIDARTLPAYDTVWPQSTLTPEPGRRSGSAVLSQEAILEGTGGRAVEDTSEALAALPASCKATVDTVEDLSCNRFGIAYFRLLS